MTCDECPICLSSLDGSTALSLACGHTLCSPCLLPTLKDVRLPDWRCPMCRAGIALSDVMRVSDLGLKPGQRIKQYIARPPTSKSFLQAVQLQAEDIEQQNQQQHPEGKQQPSTAFAALLMLEHVCPSASALLLVPAASLHVRRLLNPALPSIPQAAAAFACAFIALCGYLIGGLVLLHWYMLAGAHGLCSIFSAMASWWLHSASACMASPQPFWALVLVWACTGVLGVHQAARRGQKLWPLLLDMDARLLRALGFWALAVFVFASVVLLVRLAVDAALVFIFWPLLRSLAHWASSSSGSETQHLVLSFTGEQNALF